MTVVSKNGARPATGRPSVRIAWHGGPSFSLGLGELEILVDPAFSRPGDYPPWFNESCTNPHAPAIPDYLAGHRPDYVFITHGHFDHFDVETVRKLASAAGFRVVGSSEVLRACRDLLGLPPDRLLALPAPGHKAWLDLTRGVRVRPVPGPHWFTGAEGDAVAAKMAGRPDRYGVMPCGGPMLGFLFEVDAGEAGLRKVYVSGDTEPAGLPTKERTGRLDVAVVCCGGELLNPATKMREGPFLDEVALARAAAETVQPRILVPVHYDHPVFRTPFDPARLATLLGHYPDPPRLVVPPYNTWVTLIP